MDKEKTTKHWSKKKRATKAGRGELAWFLGFIGAVFYYLHVHSGTFWLVILAFLKAFIWPAILVYHLLLFLKV
jgi:hypothetical protein